MARHRTFNPDRVGSIPTSPTSFRACHLTGEGTGFLNLRSRFESVQAHQSGRVVQGIRASVF
jgi:hypothetical protein